ncbi:hypothetical protein CN157_09305 [Sinorhizobium meliloti]|uniref:hypothetical protein n=1 Tax=Rhizobium meliloti TaxID=382 RepID=UPI000FDA1F58|nr:hypothetical protein [Sinorhizobium meliloti]RVK79374.1 hypothetical protein CN157_09305 [Sinorhizobium meliloti]
MFSTIAAWLAAIGVQPTHLIAGLAGGIVHALVNKNGSPWERIVAGAVGALCAAFLTPFFLLLLGVTALQFHGALGFVLGLVGMQLAIGFIGIAKDYARNPGKLKDDIGSLLLRVFNKDSDDK